LFWLEGVFMSDSCGCNRPAAGGGDEDFEKKVKEVIDSVRPALQGHGGDIELVGVGEDKTVRVRLQGACSGCPGARMTLKMGVERMLKSKVPDVKEVIAVD
jgi:Fe-S cluster biogenesis protein NfuA